MKNFRLLFLLTLLFTFVIGSCRFALEEETASPEGRFEYDLKRLADPRTGEIPEGIRMQELAYVSQLPKSSGATRSGEQQYQSIGPFNVGGRTRAMKYDVTDPDVINAGGVSGGMWQTRDGGGTWTKTTSNEEPVSVNCLVQDKRTGKEDIWYYGTGERRGNSASKSSSAQYRGNGVYKSEDGGKSWQHLESTLTEPHESSAWTYVYNVAVDTTRYDSNIVFAAVNDGIMRSNDGGVSWENVLPVSGFSAWTNVHAAKNGIFYAHLSSDAFNPGIYRSNDGLNWVKISDGSFPSTHERARLASHPDDENQLYVFAWTPGSGQHVEGGNTASEQHSLFKYTYLGGDGSDNGGDWENRSQFLPQSSDFHNQLRSFTNYTMQLAVKPGDPATVFIGGTSIFRSTDGFSSHQNISQIGGYDADGYSHYNYAVHGQHPDQHEIDFMPGDPGIMIASSDGGVHRTDNCMASKVVWEDLNNGYVTSQFYSVAVAHDVEEPYVVGGLQDNGTWFSNHDNQNEEWFKMRGGDGAYTALTEQGNVGYFSTQHANIRRFEMNPENGTVTDSKDIMPDLNGQGDYSFVHAWAIDPSDDNIMYLPSGQKLYRNTQLDAQDAQNRWEEIAEISGNGDISAVSVAGDGSVVYLGSENESVFKVIHPKSSNPQIEHITSNIEFGGYTSNIAVHPHDPDQVMVVYSNYKVRSLWYSDNGGLDWTNVQGNLRGEPDNPNGLEELLHRANGPSCRWAEIIPIENTSDSSVFVLATSVGLFATGELNGEETEWTQQSSSVIGNSVVEMIDCRMSDGYMAVATHGNGIFTTYFDNTYVGIHDQSRYEANLNIKPYPNPVNDQLNVQFELPENESIKLYLRNLNGQVLRAEKFTGVRGLNEQVLQTSNLAAGNYFLTLKGETFQTTKKIVKR